MSSSYSSTGDHIFSYRYDGSDWTLTITAPTARDAKERLKALAFARYDGELVAEMPAALGFLGKVAVWMRNITRTC